MYSSPAFKNLDSADFISNGTGLPRFAAPWDDVEIPPPSGLSFPCESGAFFCPKTHENKDAVAPQLSTDNTQIPRINFIAVCSKEIAVLCIFLKRNIQQIVLEIF